jgi:gliding motility-associated-like protein
MKKITFVFILLLSGLTLGFGQSYKMSNGKITASGSGTFYDDGGLGSGHGSNKTLTQTFSAPAGQYLTFTFSEFDLGINDYLYIYDGASTSSQLLGSYTRTTAPGTIRTSEAGGSLTFYFTSDNSASANGSGWAARYGSGGGNNTVLTGENCANSAPFCTGTNYNFPNSTGVPSLGGGGIYGCLGSTPNPVWYYMQVANPGNIQITINQVSNGGTPIDVDFIAWGPFSSLAAGCGSLSTSNDVDCSYSTAATEVVDIPNAQAGQFYILLMTNFNGAAGHISFSQTNVGPGSGSTNCGILCSTVANNGPVCIGNTFNLTATSVTNATAYNWTGPNGYTSSSQNPTGVTPPSTAGTYPYTLVVTTPTGTCTATTTVTVRPTPVASAGTTTTITCIQPSALLDGSSNIAGSTLTWTGPGVAGASDPANALQAGTYTITAALNGCSSTATIAVTSNTTVPVPSFTTPDGTVLNCIIQAVNLNGSATPAGATVSWTGPSGAIAGNPANVSAPGTYTLTASDPSNGCTATTNVVVTSNGATPNISVASSPNTTIISCTDSAIVLTGSSNTPNITDGWVGPNGGIPGNPITVTSAGQYTYQITDNGNGCQSSSTVNITLDTLAPAIQATVPNNNITCAQTSVSLTGSSTSNPVSYAWTLNGAAVSGNPITVTDSGLYVLVITNTANGCTSTTSQLITKDLTAPNAGITAPNTTLTCVITSVSLLGTSTTTGGVTFSWDGPTGVSTSNPLTTSTPGTYTLTVTNPTNGCTSQQTVVISEDIAQPNVSFTTPLGTTLDCNTPTLTLNGASTLGTATLAWSGSSGTLAGNPATVGSPDTYTITATDPANGCQSVATVTVVSTGAQPNVSYTASAPGITCAIPSVTLTGASITPGVTIAWTNSAGPLSGNPVIVSTAGNYTVTVTDPGTGCVSSSSAFVAMDTIRPSATIFPSITTLTCASPSSNLTGSSTTPGAMYGWTGPSGPLAGNPVSVNTAGTYTLTVANPANGCIRTQTVTLGSNTAVPAVTISSSTTVLTCTTTFISLTANGSPGNVNYAWSGSGTGSNPVVNATNPGTYGVTVVDPANGCSASNSIIITQNTTSPGASAGPNGILNCDGSPVPMTGSSPLGGVTFVWSGPGQFVDSVATTSNNVVGTYTLTVTNPANGCTATSMMSILTNTNVPNVNAGLNQNIKCNKPTVQLTGSSSTPNATFEWTYQPPAPTTVPPAAAPVTPNNTSAICTTAVAGTYTLTVTNPATGCKAKDVMVVSNTPPPNAVASATPVVGYVPLDVTFSSAGTTGSNTYLWNFDNGATTTTAHPAVTFIEAGIYDVFLVTSISGQCKDTAWVSVEVKEVTEVIIPNIFSPNGDNSNDLFFPKTKAVAELTIDIWDRWGKHITTFDGLTGNWNGAGSSDGTYFYIAKGRGKDKSEIEQTGFVLLVK